MRLKLCGEMNVPQAFCSSSSSLEIMPMMYGTETSRDRNVDAPDGAERFWNMISYKMH